MQSEIHVPRVIEITGRRSDDEVAARREWKRESQRIYAIRRALGRKHRAGIRAQQANRSF